ncbi:MAG TPA: multicopper oxidase domain-containing protein [Casimicrobiaceae bacterium]|jgi:FtsP/CotA-like multicopper oxidase with cupredoxin domain|nr:multicopper oxidase domain-containing protein [Casimicrobiaceae bacterium]
MTKSSRVKSLLVSASLTLIALAQTSVLAQSSVSATAAAVKPVANPCPRFAAGSVVQQPPALLSHDGVLSVQFSYQTRVDAAGRTLFCFMTPDGLENPTLHVNAGDHLLVTVTNNTPAQPLTMSLDPPNCGATMMGNSSLNIHYHGTNTSPTCQQDEVIKTVINSGETFQYDVAFPENEPPGLYWYHPHIHGIADRAVLGGASGALVVAGVENMQPAVSDLRQRILVIRDQPQLQGLTEGSAGCTNGVPFQDITVNHIPIDSYQAVPGGPVTFTPAVFRMEPGEEFWRLTNSSSDTILDLQLQFDGVAQTIKVAGIDGVPVNSQDSAEAGALIPVEHFRLPPASRVEFIAHAPSSRVKLAQLVTTSISTGQNGDCDPNRPIFTIQLASHSDGDNSVADAKVGRYTSLNTSPRRFAGLGSAPIAQKRLVFFDEIQPTQFFMAVAGQPETVFDPNAKPAITATQGTVEEWTVENHAIENHEFHFHQLHFLVESQNNFEINGQTPAPAIMRQYLDMIEVPGWDGNPAHPFPNVKLRIDFRGPDIGTFVFHCHILNHEDLGMMNIIQVVPATTGKSAPVPGATAAPASDRKPVEAVSLRHAMDHSAMKVE